MSVDEKDEYLTTLRLYSCFKAICKEKRRVGNQFLKSSFSERMVQVATTGEQRGNKHCSGTPRSLSPRQGSPPPLLDAWMSGKFDNLAGLTAGKKILF